MSERITTQRDQTTDPTELAALWSTEDGLPEFEFKLGTVFKSIALNFGGGLLNTDFDAHNFETAWKHLWDPTLGPADGFNKLSLDSNEDIKIKFVHDAFSGILPEVINGNIGFDDLLDKPGLFIQRIGFEVKLDGITPIDDKLTFKPSAVWGESGELDDIKFEAEFEWKFNKANPLNRFKDDLNLSFLLKYSDDKIGLRLEGSWRF